MTRIAIFRRCGLGDAVQLTPLLQQIRADLPQASIEVFINDNAAPVLEGSPYVDRVWRLPFREMKETRADPLLFRMWRRVWAAGRFDAFLYTEVSWQRSLLLRCMRVKSRAGLESDKPKFWQPFHPDMRIAVGFDDNPRHCSEMYIRLWQKVMKSQDRGFGYDVRHLRDPAAPLPGHIALAPGGADGIAAADIKRWPAPFWKDLAERLLAAGKTPVFVGRKEELAESFIPQGAINLMGRTSMLDMVRYLSRCEGMLGNDSGPYHLSLGLGVPSIGLFGPSSSVATGPYRAPHGLVLTAPLPCIPCRSMHCHLQGPEYENTARPICMNRLTPEYVFKSTLEFLAQRQTPGPSEVSTITPQLCAAC